MLPNHIREFSSKSSDHLFLSYDRLSRTTTILGDMGCGKSRLLYLIENDIRKRYPDIPILIHDPKGEICEVLKDSLNKEEYNIIKINMANPKDGDTFNPYELPYYLYKKRYKY